MHWELNKPGILAGNRYSLIVNNMPVGFITNNYPHKTGKRAFFLSKDLGRFGAVYLAKQAVEQAALKWFDDMGFVPEEK